MARKTTAEKKARPGTRKPASATRGATKIVEKKTPVIGDRDLQSAGTSCTDIPVVGVGASAGGLEALQQLFKSLSTDCNLAFVVIQHLSPNHKSAMDQLLSRATALPVIQIKNNLKIEPGRIYLNPPEQFVSLAKGKFRLTRSKSLGRRSFLPIDHFFNVLAAEKQENAICIILSGSASDGSQGLKAVKAAGGLTVVQSPDDAKYASMPDSAIATQMVDFILPADQIAEKLIAVLKHPYSSHVRTEAAHEKDLDFNLKQIFSIVQSKTGHDFSSYKTNTVSRRIAQRMAVHQLNTFSGDPITVLLCISNLVDDKHRPVKFATFERPVDL